MALIVALGISLALGVSVTTTVAYATQNSTAATTSRSDQLALALAEAGLNNALAVLYDAADPADPSSVPRDSRQYEGGTATWYGTLEGNVWRLTGIGNARNLSRTVTARVRLGSARRSDANNAVWNYLYADALDGCTSFANTVLVNVPTYIRGNLCMSNSAQMNGYSLRVGGNVTISNSATVGSATNPIQEAHIGGTCQLDGQAAHSPCSAADRIHAKTITADAQGLTKPAVDLDYWYREARPGPMHACTQGSFPGGFDNDGVRNRSLPQVDLTPSTAYDCRVYDSSGYLIGQLSWTPGAPGSLLIKGTIYFDGDVVFSQKNYAVYQGRGTIYASGTVTIAQQTWLCGTADCSSSWDPNSSLLALIGGSSTDATSVSVANYSKFQGAVYAVNDFREGNNTTTWGPVIARQIYLQNSTVHHYVPIGTLVPGMPATYEETVTLTLEPGSFES